MQRDFGRFDAAVVQRLDQPRREMQSRGRRGDGPSRGREDGLIPGAVCLGVGALDVGRQRHVSDRVDRGVDVTAVVGPQPDEASSKKLHFDYFAVQFPVKHDLRSGLQFLPGVHQRLP